MTKKTNRKDIKAFSISSLAEFVAEFNKDGKYNKSAYDFLKWLDRNRKPSEPKKIEDWEKDFDYLLMNKHLHKFTIKLIKHFIKTLLQLKDKDFCTIIDDKINPKIQHLTEENKKLRKELQQKDKEIEKLKEEVEELEDRMLEE